MMVGLVNGDIGTVHFSCPWAWGAGVQCHIGYDLGGTIKLDVADDYLIPMVMVTNLNSMTDLRKSQLL